MMASMGPGFGHPNVMQQHPGVPGGHPMGPGMPHNPSQQGVPGGGGMPPQLSGHMNVSGAPGNQALMGTMPPSAGGPNAHALQHLNPGQGQMFPQQQLHGPMQVQLQQQQQQYLHQQQQARQALIAQQLHGNMGGVNGMPMGMNMSQMNPAQVAAMRQMRPGQNPHAQALMAQRMAMQQQQQAQSQNQHMVPGNTPGQHLQMTAQQLQNLQNQQAQIAAASMQAQASGQGQPQQGQRPQPQGQPQQPGQQTPQASQAQVQAGTPAPSGGQQTPAQTPGPTPNPQNQQQQQQQPQQAPQQQPQQQQQQPQNQQPQQPQGQMSNAAMQAQMNAAAHQLAMNSNLNGLAHQRTPAEVRSNCLLKLMQFSEHLSGYPGPKGKGDLSYWNEFVRTFFSPKGVFRHWVHISEDEDKADKQYEIAFPALARYFHTYFESGVKTMQFVMDKGTTERPMPNGFSIENSRSSFVYWFENGLHLVATGSMRAQFDENYKLDVLEFSTTGHEEFVSLKNVIKAAKPAHDWVKEWHKVNSQNIMTSPEISKKSKAKQMKSPQSAPPDALVDLPGSAVKKSMGIPEAVFQFLETAEVMGQMIPLFGYCHSHPSVGARTALEQYVSQNIQNANGQPMPQGMNMPMGASPSMAQMPLPGSPHVAGSPAPGSMQAPNMAIQKSHQGTTSSGGPSANTSPASNKRRRPSAVKEEDGTPGPQVNGTGKKPPTPRMPKKAKTSQQ